MKNGLVGATVTFSDAAGCWPPRTMTTSTLLTMAACDDVIGTELRGESLSTARGCVQRPQARAATAVAARPPLSFEQQGTTDGGGPRNATTARPTQPLGCRRAAVAGRSKSKAAPMGKGKGIMHVQDCVEDVDGEWC